MALRLEVTSSHKDLLGEDSEFSFGPEGGTIGRSLKSDWVLPDPERFISGQHATIDYQAGSYYLADTSSNGVYVNGAIEPLGKGHPRRLFDGDQIRMGNFEMTVRLDEGLDLTMPPEPKPSIVPDHIEQLVPVDDMHSAVTLLDEQEIKGENALDAAMLDAADASAIAKVTNSAAASAKREPAIRKSAAVARRSDNDETRLLNAFLRSAGIDPDDIHPSVDAAEVLSNAGEVLHELVSGLSDMLLARGNVKSMFRLDQTTVLPRHNNPLKLSVDTVDSLRQLLVGQEGDYLGPLASVREACKDLRYHHDAMVAGMIRAFDEYIERFDPEQLEQHFAEGGDRKSMFGSLGRRKHWDLYCDLYPIMTEKGPASLPRQFSEDFVRCYERQLKDFKRRELALGDTQRLDYEDPLGTGEDADGNEEASPTDTISIEPDKDARQAG